VNLTALKHWITNQHYLHPMTIPPEIRRVTHFPIFMILLFLVLIGAGVGITSYSKALGLKQKQEADGLNKSANKTTAPDWFENRQQEGLIVKPVKPELAFGATANSTIPAVEGTPQAKLPTQSGQEQIQLQQALQAETTIYKTSAPLPSPSASEDKTEPLTSAARPEPNTYLLHTRQAPISDFEIKAGTVIPSVMISGIHSDLPGQILAQVTQNVYDSVTGEILLIPQGAKLVGQYEQPTQTGQKRLLVVWNRLIYPDASSVSLDKMSGMDESGFAGFQGATNTHFWGTFGKALMLSIMTGGIQLSQPQQGSGSSGFSAPQIMAGALGQQMAQLGMGTVRRGLAQAPTLTLQPGYRFSVMVNRDMILPPYITEEKE
jgi:type IV secretion system protein VirB10